MALGEGHQLRQASHGAVIIDDLADHSSGNESGEAGDIHRGFGMAGAHQRAAIAGHMSYFLVQISFLTTPLASIRNTSL
jgi:hypothetical protein